MPSPLKVSAAFDSGSIEVVAQDDPADIQLRIRPDNAAEFAQWFHFCLHGAAGQAITLRFLNAGACAYPKGWEGYRVVASEDRRDWFRIATQYDGQVMTAQVTPKSGAIWFAYFEPYSHERHLDLVARVASHPHARVRHLGHTPEGRDMTLLQITNSRVSDAGKRHVWLIARQHPGETMAEWFVQGFLDRLLDPADPVSRVLLQRCVFHVVPNMNPDGSVRGNLRTNTRGANLNREWDAPTAERSPEVLLVREAMQQTGVDLFLDAHGDEGLPYNFVVGCEGIVGYSPRVKDLAQAFKSAWKLASPDFQDRVDYGPTRASMANPTLATNWVGRRFECLAFTIEMPFKDNADLPDERAGWNGARSMRLGASVLQPILALLDKLR